MVLEWCIAHSTSTAAMLCLLTCTAVLAVLIALAIREFGRVDFSRLLGALLNRKDVLKALYNVDPDTKQNGGDLVADVLKAHHVRHLFILCGGHITPVYVACEERGIRVVDTRHEVTAVFAADAVARLSQDIGVAAVTAGPGITNTITAVKNAQMAENPLLLLGGAAATLLKGRGALQDIDQLVLLRPLCKFAATVTRIRDIVPTIRKAIQIAKSGTPGPVFVELPIDSLYPFEAIQREMGQKSNPRKFSEKVVNLYLEWYLCRLFGNAFSERDQQSCRPLRVDYPLASNDQLDAVVRLLSAAKKPLMIIGSQAMLPPIRPVDLRKTVTDLGIPCYLGGMARGLLGRKSDLQMRQQRKQALSEADVVILAGVVPDFRLSYGRVLSRKSKIVSINRDKAQMLRNAGMFWSPAVALQADVASTVVQVADRLKNFSVDPEWIASLRARDDEKESKNAENAAKPTERHLNPQALLMRVEEHMPEDAIIVADGGDFVGSAAYILRPRGPLQWLDPGAFGTLGVGGGFALGAKMLHPDKPVWIIFGDGALGYSLIEFDTYVRMKAPVTAVIGNDAAWTQILREQKPMFKTTVGCMLEYSSYERAVEGLGAKGVLLSRDNESEVDDKLQAAVKANEEGHTVLINALIGSTSFREGSISV